MHAIRKCLVVTVAVAIFGLGLNASAALPTDEAGATAYLISKGVEITKNAQGRATRLKSGGKEKLTAEEYALIGKLTELEQIGLNISPLADNEWGFLKSLPKLKQLAIWHGHGFGTLEPFSGLNVESLTIGGCMGLRDKHASEPGKGRDVLLTLHDLPKLKKGNWYHFPLAPDDAQLVHIASKFPTLDDLRLDFSAPTGLKPTTTPTGLAALQKLPLTTLSLESIAHFGPEHFKSIAGIKSLKVLLIDARRSTVSTEAVAEFKKLRPDAEVVVAEKGATEPPMPKRKK